MPISRAWSPVLDKVGGDVWDQSLIRPSATPLARQLHTSFCSESWLVSLAYKEPRGPRHGVLRGLYHEQETSGLVRPRARTPTSGTSCPECFLTSNDSPQDRVGWSPPLPLCWW